MTSEQAVAILEAERVLQHVGSNTPEYVKGGAWHDYVKEAVSTLSNDSLLCNAFDDIYLVIDIKG